MQFKEKSHRQEFANINQEFCKWEHQSTVKIYKLCFED